MATVKKTSGTSGLTPTTINKMEKISYGKSTTTYGPTTYQVELMANGVVKALQFDKQKLTSYLNSQKEKKTVTSQAAAKTARNTTSSSYSSTVKKTTTYTQKSSSVSVSDSTVDTYVNIYNEDDDDVDIEWQGERVTMSKKQYNNLLNEYADGLLPNSSGNYDAVSDSMAGIFGMPYQFSTNVDPPMEDDTGTSPIYSNTGTIGRKYAEKIFSVAPILFLIPGEPKFMDGYGQDAKKMMAKIMLDPEDGDSDDFDEGRYYSFVSNFNKYRKYANTALRVLSYYMGIGDVEVIPPGTNRKAVKLNNIDINKYMKNDFTKLFGSQPTVPFYVDAETSISESFSNSTTESMISQTVNGFSSSAREIQFLMGGDKSLLKNIGSAITELSTNALNSLGDVADVLAGKNIITAMTNELATVVSGGKIIFPEIWSDSSYDKSYSITLKLRSPDPDPVSIFLNVYMPIILLISMAAPHQIGNSSNSYESPFLVRATYKSIFNCDLGIITSLDIQKGGSGNWNILGQPISADVTITIKDLYSSMFISKRMGMICNTAQMDYLATMAGVDLNEYEPFRMVYLYAMTLADTPRDWANDLWGGVKRTLNLKVAKVFSKFSDTRYLGY